MTEPRTYRETIHRLFVGGILLGAPVATMFVVLSTLPLWVAVLLGIVSANVLWVAIGTLVFGLAISAMNFFYFIEIVRYRETELASPATDALIEQLAKPETIVYTFGYANVVVGLALCAAYLIGGPPGAAVLVAAAVVLGDFWLIGEIKWSPAGFITVQAARLVSGLLAIRILNTEDLLVSQIQQAGV